MPGTSQVREGGDIEEFVLVLDPIRNKEIEFPLNKDGTLPITKLTFYFPGAYGLYYKHEKFVEKCFVGFDNKKNAFLAPSDGWVGKLFNVTYKDNRQRPKSPQILENGLHSRAVAEMSRGEIGQSVRKEVLQDQFIRVYDSISNETIEILLGKDGNMPIAKLNRRFPGAHFLEFINPKTGYKRDVDFDEEKKVFLAPSDGWGDKTFDVICREEQRQPQKRVYPYQTIEPRLPNPYYAKRSYSTTPPALIISSPTYSPTPPELSASSPTYSFT